MMDLIEMMVNPKASWDWAMEWAEEAKGGSWHPVKVIQEVADEMKEVFCTNGLWQPGAEHTYNLMRKAEGIAQQNYEEAQPGME